MSKSKTQKKQSIDESLDRVVVTGMEPNVEIDNEVTRRIRQHARTHRKSEVCGVLIGEDANGTIEIRASIEALNAAQAGTHVTFTQDAWEEIYRVKDELYPEERIVGWYHSHPGFGVFLSEHDMFIQQNFFSSPGQVAWVYDPHTDEEGCFGWVSGEVHRLSSLSILDRNGDGVERTPKRPNSTISGADVEDHESFDDATLRNPKDTSAWLRRGAVLFTHISALLIGFTLAYFLFPRFLAVMIDPATGEVVIRDGSALLPYLDRGAVLPGDSAAPKQPLPEHPPASAAPHSTPPTPPAQSASPRRDK
jgi:proteasome lid subunit RPN8/RPN11